MADNEGAGCFKPGNQAATGARRWRDAIDRALAKRSKAAGTEALDLLAEKLLEACDEKDVAALKEFGDRVEGKVAQAITGPDGEPLTVTVLRLTDAP